MAAVAPRTHEEIEAQIRELQARKGTTAPPEEEDGERVPLGGAYMDEDIYGGPKSKYEGYVTSIAANDDADVDDDDYEATTLMNNKKASFTVPTAFLHEIRGDKEYDPFAERKIPRIIDREDEYRAQRRKFMISPERSDPFADGTASVSLTGNVKIVYYLQQTLLSSF